MKRVILLFLVAIAGCQSTPPDPNARCYTCEALNNNAAVAQQNAQNYRPPQQRQPVHCQSNTSNGVTNTYCN